MANNYLKLKRQLNNLGSVTPKVTVVEDEYGNKVNQSIRPTLDKISPTKQTSSKTNTKKTTTNEEKRTWFSPGAFEDGYQIGDGIKTILGTGADVVTGVTKGIFSLGEGVGDLINYGIAGVADLAGKDAWADGLRQETSKSLADQLFSPAEKLYDKYSVLGEKSDTITQGLGNVAGIIATGGVGKALGLASKGVTALTTGATFVSSMGSGMGEAYQSGATDSEAATYGMIKGAGDALTELIFGGLGKAVNATGLSTGISSLDDALALKISSKINNQIAKNFVEYGVKASAEGSEEVLAGIVSAVGKKVTYMSEEELTQIIEDENLLEQFIAGAVTSGIAQSGLVPGMTQGSLKEANKTGRDFITGYTQNEQAIVDKEIESRIAEAQKEGKVLTNKEKTKIKETVEEELQKGYISTDTIESTFGGDTYNQLKAIRDQKTSLEQKKASLEQEKTQLGKEYSSVENTERYNALKDEISAIDKQIKQINTNTLENELQSVMSQKIANDGYLQRSYQEKANRSVKFEADLSKYDVKQQEVIQKAIDSGILNNTNKTHEFVDMIAKISADKGVSFDFANNAKLKESGFAIDGKQVNGLVNENGVTLNIDSAKALNTVVGHEITHVLEGTELYTELQQAVKEYATTKGEYDTRLANLTELYKGVEGADVENELTADLVGEYLFTDVDFVNNLSTTKPNVFKKIYNEIKYLLKVATAGSKEARQLEKVKKTFEEAYRNNQTNVTNDTQYSLNDYQEYTNKVNEALEKAKNIDEKFYNDLKAQQEEYRERHQLEYNILEETNSRPATNEKINDVFFKEHRSEYDENRGIKTADGKLTVMHLQKGDNLAKLSFTEAEDKIWIDELYVKNQKQGYGSEIVNAIKKYADENGKYVEAFKELSTAKGFWDKTLRNGAKYSLTDNQGRTLTKEQQEYFKDSKVRDESGNLEIVYHSTPNEFTVFDRSMSGENTGYDNTAFGTFVTTNKAFSERFKDIDNQGTSGYTMELYANVTNPIIHPYKAGLKYGDEQASKIVEDYYKAIGETEALEEMQEMIEYEEADSLYDAYMNIVQMDSSGIYESADSERSRLEKAGYDAVEIIEGYESELVDGSQNNEAVSSYVIFNSNQLKNADNTNPTSDADIRYSLGEDTTPKQSNLTYGEDVALQISPLQEEISKVVEEVQQMRKQIDKMVAPTPEYRNNTYEDLEALEQQYNEDFENLDTENVPQGIDDDSTFFLPNEVNMVESEKQVKDVIRNTLGLNVKQTSDVYKSIVAIEDFDIDDVKNAIEEYSQFITNDTDTNLQDLKKTIRTTKLDISYLKETDSTFKDYVKNAFGTMRLANSGQSIDSFYNEMSTLYPELLPNNIDNEADQFQRLLEVSKMDHITKYSEAIPEETMDAIAKEVYQTIKNYQDNLAIQNSNKDFFDAVRKGEIIAPIEETVEKVRETVEETSLHGKEVKVDPKLSPTMPISMEVIESNKETIKKEPSKVEQQVAQILDEKPTKKFDNKRLKAVATVNLVDKGYYISKLARQTNNRQLDALWDNTLLSNAQAQEVVGEGRFKLNEETKTYEKVGNSVYEIFEGVENTNKVKKFNEYMYHKLNVERMSLEANAQERMKTLKETVLKDYTLEDIKSMAKMQIREDADQRIIDTVNAAKEYKSLGNVKNKPVFGFDIDAETSIDIVNNLEQENPEFSDYAKKVYDYESGTYSDLSLLVESGILSQEDANYYKGKYESYVPIIRDMEATMLEGQMFGKRVSVGNAVKSATGGSQNIIPLKDAMAIKTMLIQRSANMNKLGLELMHTLNPVTETETVSAENIIEDISNNKDIVQAGTNGKAPTMTVYEHGVKHTFEIPMEIYEALKVNYDSITKATIKPLNAYSNYKRGVLTQYNPFFMVTNMIKDAQDVLINSQHPASTYASIPEAIAQLTTKGYWYKEMQAQGLFQDTYYDNQNGFDTTKKGLSKITEFYPLRKISEINDFIERVPRMAEYIASRKAGASVEVASLDASRVTTNFKAGGDFTKFLNRNGFTFLNASVQGALQQVRNVQEAHQKGLKGYMALATKFAIAALPAVLLNNLIWDDDEEYEELSDYIKDNYYIIGKYGDGQFIRIPKGRMTAVIQKSVQQMQNLVTGDDEVDMASYLELVLNNIAPANPLENNILAPFTDTKLFSKDDPGKTWYGSDLVPTRLQDKPIAEQYDESTDELSKWLGKTFNLSPIKINNLIDQNTGVIGDLLLPMMTAEAKTKNSNPIMAGIEDKFTADVVFDNKYSTDFYSTKEDLAKASNGYDATDEDVLKTKYMNSMQAQMNDLYAEIRDVQNSDMDKETKYAKVRELRKQLNEIAETALSNYEDTEILEKYATVGGKEYYKNAKDEWTAIKEDEANDLNSMGMSSTDKENYFEAKNIISNLVKEYKGTKEGLSDEDEDAYETEVASLSSDKKVNIINTIKYSGLNDVQKAYLYDKYYASTEKLNVVVSTGIGMDNYLDLEAQNFTADKDKDGKTISGSKKKKIFDYINSTNLEFEQKVILAKMYYSSYDEYNYEIVDYLNNRNDINYDGMIDILKTLGFKVDGTRVTWD